ncbi:hypothetical protein D3C81_457010 [compost metagenome]
MARAARSPKAQRLEDTPEFAAALAALPDSVDELPCIADQMELVFHDAMLAGDEAARQEAITTYEAVIYKMNGGTFFGCKANCDSPAWVLMERHAAEPGQVPRWGQKGEFLVTLADGLRIYVRFLNGGLSMNGAIELHAVDVGKPFPSSSGYRHHYFQLASHEGRSVAEAVRLEIEHCVTHFGLTDLDGPVAKNHLPAWLTAALASEQADGQLSMFADQPPAKRRGRPATGKAKPAAQRAKEYRDRQREKRAEAEAIGVSPTGDRKLDEAFQRPGHIGREKESLRNLVLICTLRRRNSQHAELIRTIQGLQARLRAAGLSDEVPAQGFKGQPYYWNENPPVDYRPTGPEGDSTPHSSEEEAIKWAPNYAEQEDAGRLARALEEERAKTEQLKHRIRGLENENALVVAERTKAFAEVDRVRELLQAVETEINALA